MNNRPGTPAFREEAFTFHCGTDRLTGILCRPAQAGDGPASDMLVVIVVGGPQYRVGSHRQFVLLSRALASQGLTALRFDMRGMGDSEGTPPGFEHTADDIAAAVDAGCVRAAPIRKVVLWGLCDGASAALLYWHARKDPRVTGLCVVNPWVRTEQGLAQTYVRHYYRQRLMQPSFWLKVAKGQVGGDALRGLWRNVQAALGRQAAHRKQHDAGLQSYQQRMASAWHGFPGNILLILSGNDFTAREFLDHTRTEHTWQGALERPCVHRQELDNADHTFSRPAHAREVEHLTLAWLHSRTSGA